MIYDPAEDSFLLQKYVNKHAKGKVLDVGCGSGIQTFSAAEKEDVGTVLGIDVNPDAIKHCEEQKKENAFKDKIEFLESDLFENVKGMVQRYCYHLRC